jgi:hypothetical protein
MPLNVALLNQQSFSQSDGNQAIDTILTQEANRIGQDIHRRTLHVSPWMDLIKQTSFPDGMGYTLGTLIYDRALPVTAANGSVLGTNWIDVGQYNLSNTPTSSAQDQLQTGSTLDQVLIGARDSNIGAGTNNTFGKSFISFGRQLKQYSLKRATVESPRINVEDLRFAAYRTEQLRAVMDALTDATRYSWEERYRDEYDRIVKNAVVCHATSTVFADTGINGTVKEGAQSWTLDLDAGSSALGTTSSTAGRPTANISNKILDSIYFRLVRVGAGTNAYGRENARPVFALVCSSEASYALQTEAGFRDDIRYNNAKVSELIAPLGIEKSFRGFYHLIDDLAPRFATADAGSDGVLDRIYPYTIDSTTKVTTINPAYEGASYEAAYILHQDVMESQIPEPISGSNGLTFDPVNYRGKFAWKNIPSIDLNPDGTVGFFRGVLASASKPIKTEFGYVILFKRDSTVPAA